MIATRRNQPKICRAYEPTSRDIRRACERIQASWSPRERAKRAGCRRTSRWSPPNVCLAAIVDAVNDDRAESPTGCGGESVDVEG